MPIGYTPLMADSFRPPPPDIKRVMPLKKREDLLKSNYNLGEEKTDY